MRYLVFSGEWYYPLGGGEDFRSAHDSLEAAEAAALKDSGGDHKWAHVFDTERCKCVSFFTGGHRDALRNDEVLGE